MTDPKRYTHGHVALHAAARPSGYLEEIAPAILSRDEVGVTYDRAHPAWIATAAKYEHLKPTAAHPKPVDPSAWPWAVRVVAKARQPHDAGVGDVVARLVGPMGGDAYKRWYRRLVGTDCGCDNRRGRLNRMYPFTGLAGHLKYAAGYGAGG